MNRQELIERLIEEEQKYGLPALLDYIFGSDIKVKLRFSLRDCETGIDELCLSVRSQNALKRADIMTLGVLIDALNEGKVKGLRNLGRKSFREIQTRILVYGYEKLNQKEKQQFFDDLIEENRQ
ncbi:MAG: DNA-directed RNA polymerase subunit alpha C-terminal domain-containing protein [Eubacteriaceae bacterium]|nr:DNA-directed RNA polymerase subunit alpha C-terminal domain-containing protein [Eubacteriaceae bacterium]